MSTCLCSRNTARTTYTLNPTTGEGLWLCATHANLHRLGHGFPVATYKEDK